MSGRTLISVEEYLASSFRPDCEYVDGHIEERNWGEWNHSEIQGELLAHLLNRYLKDGIRVMPELRIQVKPQRFRIPDLCVLLKNPGEQVLTKPPFLCIEVLSPEDRMTRVEERINDYLDMGVPYIWVLDPETRKAFFATSPEGLREVTDGVLRTQNPALEVPLDEMFR